MSAMEYESEPRGYEDEGREYDRERSRSPRGNRNDDVDLRDRNEPSNGRDDAPIRTSDGPPNDDDDDDPGAINPGSNLFVTGIHPRLTEEAVTRLFEKYGEVEKCQIMRDPHSGDSRGFGFVKMVTSDQADAAKDGLQGMVHEGRTLSIEKARRARPRTPTPGKYYGPPKRDDFRRPRGRGDRGGGRFGGRDSYDDRRRGYGGRGGDDYYSGGGGGGGGGYRSRYDDRYDDRGHGGGRRERDDYGSRQVDRYASGGGRDDRSYGRGGDSRGGDDRRGGGGGYYDRPSRDYGGAPAEDRGAYGGGDRAYDDRAPR